MRDRTPYIIQCEQIEGKLWNAVVETLSKLTSITFSHRKVYGFLYPEYAISSLNRVMGYSKNIKDFQRIFDWIIDLGLTPFYLSSPPLSYPYIELVDQYNLVPSEYESVYFADLSSYDLEDYSLSEQVEEATIDDLEEIVTLYQNEFNKITRSNLDEVRSFFKKYYRSLFQLDQVHFYKVEDNIGIISFGGIYIEGSSGYIFSDITRKSYRRQGLQRDLVIHRGLSHGVDRIYSTITKNGYNSSIGNALDLGATHLYDRTIYRYNGA